MANAPLRNALNWFEIPAVDFERAVAFYTAIFGSEMYRMEMEGMVMATFDADRDGVSGAVIKEENNTPSSHGTRVYLNATGRHEEIIGRVEPAGGKVIVPRFPIGEHGFCAIVMDPEGNVVGLHSVD